MTNDTTLRNLMHLRSFSRHRVSSFDRSGGNMDMIRILPGEKRTIFDEIGPGCITHIWSTQSCSTAPFWPRHLILRIWWDDETTPSVECPLSDFFGLGHGERHNFVSLPLQMSPEKGKGFNCWFPMPFKTHARIELENDNPTSTVTDVDHPLRKVPGIFVYYYIDFEHYTHWEEDPIAPIGYFHSQFRRKNYFPDCKTDFETNRRFSRLEWQLNGGKNTKANGGYDRNHVILEATGKGHYVGCHIDIDNRARFNVNWPGEGDDMIFIDDDIGKEPTLYGTGTEDYVNMAYCPQQFYNAPYHGVIKGGGFNWGGKITYYRYHIEDPIAFQHAIKVTIEHGHNNLRGDIWETTAYWYQQEPHAPFPPFPSRSERMPRKERKFYRWFLKLCGFLLKFAACTVILYSLLRLILWFKWI